VTPGKRVESREGARTLSSICVGGVQEFLGAKEDEREDAADKNRGESTGALLAKKKAERIKQKKKTQSRLRYVSREKKGISLERAPGNEVGRTTCTGGKFMSQS